MIHFAADPVNGNRHTLWVILETHRVVVEDGFMHAGNLKHRSYAVSTLRGGVGKSTLAFNLAHELSLRRSLLVADVCAQRNNDRGPPVRRWLSGESGGRAA